MSEKGVMCDFCGKPTGWLFAFVCPDCERLGRRRPKRVDFDGGVYPIPTVEALQDALNKAAPGANELNEKLRGSFELSSESAGLKLR